MNLEIDAQTIEDLRIFSKGDTPGIFDLYNKTSTRGGEDLLRELFQYPLSDAEAITRRNTLLTYFAKLKLSFPFDGELFDMAEKYIRTRPKEGDLKSGPGMGEKEIHNGVSAIIKLLNQLKAFMQKDAVLQAPSFEDERSKVYAVLNEPALEPVFKEDGAKKIAFSALTAFDLLFRKKEYEKIECLLNHIYLLDVYFSVARVATERGFVFPEVHEKGSKVLHFQGLYHAELDHPISNDVSMEENNSVIFLTGANMAGKSTFLRAISTAVYLAHMGFPVAATSMAFSVMDGIYTTINLPDNLGIGASHFYAEVLRVKKVASELSKGKALFVIFDELFRGTNVKDAYEATVAITEAFVDRSKCRFIISSHIVEAAEDLQVQKGIAFAYLPTRMNEHIPEYTYKLEQGVTDDRHGMIIIRNEGILDILKNGKKKAALQVG